MLCFLAVQSWGYSIAVGVTSKDPASAPQKYDNLYESDHSWFVGICYVVTAYHKGQMRNLPWELRLPKGRAVGCCVSQTGQFYLYYNGKVLDDILWEGLPTNQPLWGVVIMHGEWKVEVDFVVATPKGEAVGSLIASLYSYIIWVCL